MFVVTIRVDRRRGMAWKTPERGKTKYLQRQKSRDPAHAYPSPNRTFSFYSPWALHITVLLKLLRGYGYAVLRVCASR